MTTATLQDIDRAQAFIGSLDQQRRDFVAETQARLTDTVAESTALADALDAFRAEHADFLTRIGAVSWRRLDAVCGYDRIQALLNTARELHGLLDNSRGLRRIADRVEQLPAVYRVSGEFGLRNEEASILSTLRINESIMQAVAQRLGRLQALVHEAVGKLPAAAQLEGLGS